MSISRSNDLLRPSQRDAQTPVAGSALDDPETPTPRSCMNGVYALMLYVSHSTDIRIGTLGTLRFRRGTYAYVGSAQNGLQARLERHLRKDKKTFWHIDYLVHSKTCGITRVFFENAPKQRECTLAHQLGSFFESVSHFGSSDCDCASHLFRVSNANLAKKLMQRMDEYPLVGE